jgi:hypothetical protein
MAPFPPSSKEKFLILDVAPGGACALFFSFDERRELVFEKVIEHVNLGKFLASQASSIFQKSWEGNYFFNSRRRLMVFADSKLATTVPVPLDFKRNAALAGGPITLGEAENWFAHAMAKIFTPCRLEAARRLDAGEINTVLVNQRISRVTIDGCPVSDSLGRSGKKISFVLELTFANRELSETLTPFFNAPGEFFFAEAAQARLAALARVRPLPVSILESAHNSGSSLFILQGADKGCPVVYREPFPWDGEAMVGSIARDLGIVPSAAEEIYGKYIRREVSDAANKYLDSLIAPASKRFLEVLDKADLRGSMYQDSPRDLPFKLPYRRRRVTLEAVPVDAFLKKFGFSVREGLTMEPRTALRYLVPFFELYFDNNRSELNELLRRKLHWLSG